ncbi:MAG: DUF72 domain-containing protein [Chloroflexia bacterium]
MAAGTGRSFVGTSGWIYPHWRGVFYPPHLPQKAWFAHYAGHFDTVEINNTFYRLPGEAAFRNWQEQAPPGFLYALKVSRYITHMKKLQQVEEALDRFLERTRLLGDHLGPLLYQLPPGWHGAPERLEAFLRLLPGDLLHVFEFRHPSWFCAEIFALLERYGAALCLPNMPGLESPRRAVGPAVYVRMHGAVFLYASCYSREELEDWAGWLSTERRAGRDVYVYFNNDAFGYAVENARQLRELLETA